jgi:hypothetical protein
MKVDAGRIQPPVTEQSKHNAPTEIRQPKPKSPTKQDDKSSTITEAAHQQNRSQGAIRLVQEGHFKGVAALRLSINFFDQLSALEQETIQVTAQEGVAELNLAMQEQVAGLNNSGLIEEEALPQLAELADTFISKIQNSIAGEKSDQQQLTATLEQHYGDFRAALKNLLLPPEPTALPEADTALATETDETSTEANQGAENSQASTFPLETELLAGQTANFPLHPVEESENQTQLAASLDALDSTFRSQLSSIEDRMQGAALPSVPEAPDNNGAAFQKFLTIYREMQGMAELDNEQAETKDS